MLRRVLGKDLKVGDTIEVWWAPKADTITNLIPYGGALAYLFPEGAQIAKFAINKTGMTIDNELYFSMFSARTDRENVISP